MHWGILIKFPDTKAEKGALIARITALLEKAQTSAIAAAAEAHATATHSENIAENKYDTLGLEAAYLAHGQSQRAANSSSDLTSFQSLSREPLKPDQPIKIGTLVLLTSETKTDNKILFLAPAAGGLKLDSNDLSIIVVTPDAPLGAVILGKTLNDEFEITIVGKKIFYEITAVL